MICLGPDEGGNQECRKSIPRRRVCSLPEKDLVAIVSVDPGKSSKPILELRNETRVSVSGHTFKAGLGCNRANSLCIVMNVCSMRMKRRLV